MYEVQHRHWDGVAFHEIGHHYSAEPAKMEKVVVLTMAEGDYQALRSLLKDAGKMEDALAQVQGIAAEVLPSEEGQEGQP